MEQNIKYDAFISYRHCELDQYVAENLVTMLEEFKLPKNILKENKFGKTKINRIFRDQDELPISSSLEDNIVTALGQSEYLIVICSPRIKESIWCQKEIETFIRLRGRDNILTVLVEGEPKDAFPEILTYRDVNILKEDGTYMVRRENIEPLAADIRGANKKECMKLLKKEILRLVAPMFKLSYDDLRQRHRERQIRRKYALLGTVAAVGVVVGVVATITAMKIHNQKLEIQSKNEKLATNQAEALAENAIMYIQNGDRIKAIQTAYTALTNQDGVKLPYTSKAEYALSLALNPYASGERYEPYKELNVDVAVDCIRESSDGKYLLLRNNQFTYIVYDLESFERVFEKQGCDIQGNNVTCEFIDDETIIYIAENGETVIYSLTEEKVLKVLNDIESRFIRITHDNKYIILGESDKLNIYNFNNFKRIASIEREENDENILSIEDTIYYDGEKNYLFYALSSLVNDENYYVVYDIKNKKEVQRQAVDFNINLIKYRADAVYIAGNPEENQNSMCDSYVEKYNIVTGAKKWTYTSNNQFVNTLYVSLGDADSDAYVVVCGGDETTIISAKTGERITKIGGASRVVEIYEVQSKNNIFIVYEDGSFEMYVGAMSMAADRSYEWNNKNGGLITNAIIKGNYIITTNKNSGQIIIYAEFMGKDLCEVDEDDLEKILELEEEKEYDSIYNNTKESVELAKELDIPSAKNVYSLFEVSKNGKKYYVVQYNDNNVTVYDEMINIVFTDTIEYRLCKYDGEDLYGNSYFCVFAEGYVVSAYVFNENMEIIRYIFRYIARDDDKELVYIKTDSKYYSAPIYQVEDLIDMAKEYTKLNKISPEL